MGMKNTEDDNGVVWFFNRVWAINIFDNWNQGKKQPDFLMNIYKSATFL